MSVKFARPLRKTAVITPPGRGEARRSEDWSAPAAWLGLKVDYFMISKKSQPESSPIIKK
jgi:hypothetical protein